MLEIGCGAGVATRLVLEQLSTGQVTALDRSQKMIDMVRAGSPEAVATGRLVTRAEALEDTDFGDERFDVVFAVNVDFGLRLGDGWPGMIAALLRQGGRFVLAFEAPPGSDKAKAFAQKSAALLEGAGFAVMALPMRDGVVVVRGSRKQA